MPAGTYYVGDLCYVFQDEMWDEVCDKTFDPMTEESIEGVFGLDNGIKFAMFGTAYGDGEYSDKQNRRYLVDSGTIGCVLLKDVSPADTGGGNVVEFKEPFECSKNGAWLTFGPISINTAEEELDYDEEVFDEWDRD